MFSQMKKTLFFLVVLLSQSLSAAPQDGKLFKDWITRCAPPEEGQQCYMEQNIVAGKEKKLRLLTVQVGYFEQKRIANFILPLGVLLQQGVALEIDGFKFSNRTPYTFCNQAGCSASVELDDKMVSLLKKGRQLTTTIFNPGGEEMAIPVSLKGFTPAFDSLLSN